MSHKPLPIGITPRYLWLEQRRDDLYAAIRRYRDAFISPSVQWLEELLELERYLQSGNSTAPYLTPTPDSRQPVPEQ